MYDEPGSRTRLAWLRTGLATLAVCALILRGLILRQASWVEIGLVIASASALAAFALIRSTQLHPQKSSAPSPRLLGGTAAAVVALALLGSALIASASSGQ